MARERRGPIDVKIGSYLIALRLGSGLSEKQVARALDVSQQLVSRQERGTSRLSVTQLLHFAAFYGRTLAQLIAEMALDDAGRIWVAESKAAPYEASPSTHHGAGGELAREPFLLNLAQLRDPAERKAVLDLYNRFKQRQSS